MRENLLKNQPTWGLRRAQGTGQKSATPASLTKVLLVLLTMLLLPSTAWGENYPITVAGVKVTDANATNVLNDDETATVSFTPASDGKPATLTLNGATIDMSAIPELCPIESSIANLTIQLIGYNKLIPNSDNINGIRFTDGTTTGNLTFTTSNVVEEYGSLSVEGIYQFSDLTSGYNVTNSFTTGEQTGWTKTEYGAPSAAAEYKYVRIDYIEYYDVWVGGARLSSSNLSPVSGGTKYIPSMHTLHLAGYGYSDEIKSGLQEFIVEVSGSNNSVSNITTVEGNTSGTIIFKKDESSVSGNKVDFTGSVKGFSSVTITPPLQLVSPSGVDNPTSAQWNSFTNVSIADFTTTYDITVAGEQVTDQNAEDILGNGTVSYDAENHKLTLNNANLTSPINWGIDADLTIELKGTNSMNTSEACISSEFEREISFTGGGDNGSLELSTVTDAYFFSGFSNTDNPSMGTGMYWIPTWNDGNMTSVLIANSLLGGGKGTEGEPFIISTFDHLKTFAKYVNDGILSTEYIKLGASIECPTNETGFEPIGNSNSFIGTFNGDGNSITGLIFNNTDQDGVAGLFGNIGKFNNGEITRGTVKNLTLSGCQFGNGARNGAIAGNLAYGTIENCTVTSCTISSGNSQSTYSGGITGIIEGNGIVKDCSVNGGTITSSTSDTSDGEVCAGGIVAEASGSSEINGCTVTDVSINSTCNRGHNSYSGGIVGSSQATISGNSVEGTTTVNSINNENNETYAGAIVANKTGGLLTENYYDFTVKTKTTIGNNDPVEKSGYTQRAVGGSVYNEQTEQYEDAPDISEDNGAVMYTRKVTFPTVTGATITKDGNYYSYDATGINIAPGQTATMIVKPSAGYSISSFTATNVDDADISSTALTENRTQYSFVMPDAAVTVNVTCNQVYNLWIGNTQVTDANASNVLSDGKVSFTKSVGADTAPTYTLTLNGAALTAPVKVGLANLTIDIQGTNTITTNTTCIQNTAATGVPSLTFKSSGDVVGSLTLTDTDEEGTNGVISDSFFEHFTISKELALIMLREGNYTSNTYYFSAGEVHNAQLLPSYGVQIGDTQIHAGNAADVFEDGTVSFDKTTNTLTLNGANTGALSTWLPELKVELVGSNKLSEAGSYPVLRSLNDAKVTIKIQSTSATKGSLTMSQPYTEEKNFYDGNVTVSIVEPLAVVSGSLEGNDGNANTVVIGESYGLTVAGVTVSNVNASAVTGTYIQKKTDDGFVSYDAESNTLTLNNVNLSTTASAPIIVSSLDALKVNIVGEVEFEFKGNNPSYVFNSTNTNGVLTFTTTDDGAPQIFIDNGSNNGAFTGFKTVNYENGLALRTNQIDLTDYWIEPMAAPMVGDSYVDEETGKFTVNIGTKYDYVGATIKYSIDYADNHTDVSDAVYGTSVVMEGPGTLTAYIAVGESTSPVTTAKWFAFASHEVQGVKGQESVAVPAVIPTIETSDDITVTYSSENATIASVSEGNIAFNGVGATTISGLYEIGDEVPFIILNDGDIFDEIAVTVVPPAPVIAYDGTKTYLSTDKIEISLDPTYAAAPSGSNTIYYSWDENPTTGTEYPEGGVEAQNGTLTAWVVATVSDVNYPSAKATQEFTVKTDISSYIVSGLAESETYTGSAIVPEFTVKATATATTSLTANTDYTVSYKKVGESEALTDVTSMVDAGSYKIIITGAGNYGGSISKDFEIKKASVDWENTGWTSPEAKADLVFTNEAKDLITGATVPDGVTVKYCYKYSTSEFDEQTRSELPDPANWTTTFPQGTNIGYYAVFYKVEGGNNYEDWGPNEVGIVINIGKGEANITADNQTTTYNGSPIEYEKDNITLSLETISKDGIGISYIGPDPNDPGKTITLDGAPTAAGTYTVEITLADEHYNAETVNATLTIEQLDISQADITLDNTVLTYNGEQQTVNVTKVMAGDIEVPIDCYEVSGNTEKEAGDYKLTVTAKTMDSSGNPIKNNFTGSAEKAWKININHRTASAEELGFKSETQTASTYYNSDEDFNLPEGYVAYIIIGINGNSVTTQRVSYIPNGVAVLVEKGQSSESPNDATPYPSTLPLKGTLEPVDVTSITDGTVYVLYNGEFVKSTSGTIPAHRCYLLFATNVASGTRSFSIDHGDGTTALREVRSEGVKGEKLADGEWYTLQGRKFTTKPTKPGLYILNGKKIVVK